MLLFINTCVRGDSRTKRLADCLLHELAEPVTELRLWECEFPSVDEAYLMNRDRLIAEGKLNDPALQYARQFARADTIVIAAPFWDLSFPASLKQYLELVNVVGVTFRYTPEGIPEGLCHAKKLYYITTAGGSFLPEEYGFGYVNALARNYYGIQDVRFFKAAGLDILGADVEGILQNCERDIQTLCHKG